MSQRGMTLVELLVGTALIVGGGGALLVGMHYAMAHADYLSDFQVAVNAAQGKLEELALTSFMTLSTDPKFADARAATGQCVGLEEDRNCSGTLEAGEDINGNAILDEPLVGARLNIRFVHPGADPALLDLYVAACWASHGRAIGEDQNCNGRLDAGEDKNGNGIVDSPVMLTTRVATKE